MINCHTQCLSDIAKQCTSDTQHEASLCISQQQQGLSNNRVSQSKHVYHIVPAGGEARLEVFKHVVSVPDASKTSLAWSFAAFHRGELWVALVTFL
jgi:hypothetical protein